VNQFIPSNDGLSFGVPPTTKVPAVLKPFEYCVFRVKDAQTGAVDLCDVLACGEVEGFKLCGIHGQVMLRGLEREGME